MKSGNPPPPPPPPKKKPASAKKKKPVGIEEPAQAAEITEDHPSADHVGTASLGASTCDNSPPPGGGTPRNSW